VRADFRGEVCAEQNDALAMGVRCLQMLHAIDIGQLPDASVAHHASAVSNMAMPMLSKRCVSGVRVRRMRVWQTQFQIAPRDAYKADRQQTHQPAQPFAEPQQHGQGKGAHRRGNPRPSRSANNVEQAVVAA
jgi:hypothetical protein